MVFCPEHLKRDQNLKFTAPLSGTMSIPTPFIGESLPPSPRVVYLSANLRLIFLTRINTKIAYKETTNG